MQVAKRARFSRMIQVIYVSNSSPVHILPLIQILTNHLQAMHRPESSFLQKRRTEIRSRLRRDEIEDYFEQRRKQFYKREQQRSAMHHSLFETKQKRLAFLDRINSDLKETTLDKWPNILQQIKISIPFFEGNHQAWGPVLETLCSQVNSPLIEESIIRELIKTFTALMKSQYQRQCQPLFATAGIIYHQVITNVNFLLNKHQIPILSIKQYLHFFACTCRANYKTRNYIIELGIGNHLIQYGNALLQSQLITDEHLRYCFLGISSDFLIIFPQRHNFIDASFVASMFPLIEKYIDLKGEVRTIDQALRCLFFITKLTNKAALKGFQSANLLQSLFELSRIAHYRPLSIAILHKLSADGEDKIPNKLFDMGILDLLLDINNQEGAPHFLTITINTINNLVICPREVEIVTKHPVWNVVINGLTSHNNKVKEDAYHCVRSVFHAVDGDDDNAINLKLTVVQFGKIIDTAIVQVTDYRTNQWEITLQAIKLLRFYIQALIAFKKKLLLVSLDSIYHLTDVLEEILNHGQNCQVIGEAETIAQIYTAALMDEGQSNSV